MRRWTVRRARRAKERDDVSIRHRILLRNKGNINHVPLYATFCGKQISDPYKVTNDDRKTTCRTCLRAMGQRERNRLKWKEQP